MPLSVSEEVGEDGVVSLSGMAVETFADGTRQFASNEGTELIKDSSSSKLNASRSKVVMLSLSLLLKLPLSLS